MSFKEKYDTYPDYNDITNSKFKDHYVLKAKTVSIAVWQFQEDNTTTQLFMI